MTVLVLATSSTQPNKADCSKYVICQDQVEKLMLVVKTEDSGLNTFLNRLQKEMYSLFKHMVT